MPCSFDDKVIIEKAEFKKFTAGGDIFRVGIISNTQLPPNEKKLEENDLYVRHLRTALEELKNNGVGMILFAGDIGDEDSITLSFAAAADDDFVHSCKVVIDDKEEKLFFSDYYNGIGSMSKTVELTLKSDGQKHNYKIYALDSWGAQSKDCIEIGA